MTVAGTRYLAHTVLFSVMYEAGGTHLTAPGWTSATLHQRQPSLSPHPGRSGPLSPPLLVSPPFLLFPLPPQSRVYCVVGMWGQGLGRESSVRRGPVQPRQLCVCVRTSEPGRSRRRGLQMMMLCAVTRPLAARFAAVAAEETGDLRTAEQTEMFSGQLCSSST